MLNAKQLEICKKTISSNTFLQIVRDAIERGNDLSVVRCADGEKKLFEHCCTIATPDGPLEPFGEFTATWMERYGIAGITKSDLAIRIWQAATQCTWFAPSVSGLTQPSYDVYDTFPDRPIYADNFFPNLWLDAQKVELFQLAQKVLFIHGNRGLADAMQGRAKTYYGVNVSFIELTNWSQAESVIEQANEVIKAPLTIFAAGPGSKFIGPRIKGVTLDIGAAAVRWTFSERFESDKAKAKALGRLDEFMRSPYTFKA